MTIGFRDHEGFHRAAAAMAIGGAAAGVGAGIAGVGVSGALYAGATGAVLGAAWADRAGGRTRFALRVALLAAAVGAFAAIGGHLGVLALAAVVGVALNLGVRGARLVAAGIVGGAVAYLGGFAAGQVMVAEQTAPLPHLLEVALASTAMATVCVAGLLPRHLTWTRAPEISDPEVRALLARGRAVVDDCAGRLDADGRALLRDGVTRLHEMAARWSDAGAAADTAEVLEARAQELDRKIDAATDEVARAQYREARAAIDDQLRYVGSIRQSRERVLARLHACVATLEKFRLAATHLESKDAALLTEVSADLDACGAAIAEIGA